MQYAYGRGRRHRTKPRFDRNDPHAIAICDGCGFLVQHNTLSEQREYRGGSAPVPTGVWKCPSCIDVPQPYFSRQLLKPDPVPVRNPRPDFNPTYDILTQVGDRIITQSDENVVTQGGSDGGIADVTNQTPGSVPGMDQVITVISPTPIQLLAINDTLDVIIDPQDAITAAFRWIAPIVNMGAYYVNTVSGSDSNAGSFAAPFQTYTKAFRTATGAASRVVALNDATVDPWDLRNTDASQATEQFKWLDANGHSITLRSTGPDLTTQTWTQNALSNWFTTTLMLAGVAALQRVLRTDVQANGYNAGLFKLTSQPVTNGTTPSYYFDPVGKVVWVNLGGLNVETNKSVLRGLYTDSAGTSRVLSIGSAIGFSGVRFEGVQFVTLDGAGRNPEFWLHDCTVLWSIAKGFDGTQMGMLVATDTIIHSSEADAANAFQAGATGPGFIQTARCTFSYAGDVNVFPADGTLQGTSAHGGSTHVGFSNRYVGNNGQGVADTTVAGDADRTWLAACTVEGGNTSSANYEFGSGAGTRVVHLDTCTSTNAPVLGDLKIDTGATVYTRNCTLPVVTGGTVIPYG